MPLQDYAAKRDRFELQENQHYFGFSFPCSDCKNVRCEQDAEPCRSCDHNANAVPDWLNNDPDKDCETCLYEHDVGTVCDNCCPDNRIARNWTPKSGEVKP